MDLHKTLIQRLLFPLDCLRTRSMRTLRYLREFEKTQFLTAEELQALQFSRLKKVLLHAWRECPFYRNRFDEISAHPNDFNTASDLAALPPLTKEHIQKHRADLVARSFHEKELINNQTGGSTGEPIAFCFDTERKFSRDAAAIRHNRWAGFDIGSKVAKVWGAPQDVPTERWRTRIRHRLLDRSLYLDTSHVTEALLVDFNNKLKVFRPDVIQAYARSIAMMARFLESRGMSAYQPASIITSAEMLTREDREVIERVFGCQVFDRYGSREVSVLASECEHHQGMHLMAEGLLVEIVNDQNEPITEGIGQLLVTDLLNYGMPLLRYRIGDKASWKTGACPCGRQLPRIDAVHGRVTDFLVGTDGQLISGVFLATYVVAQRPSLGQVQLVQDVAGQLLYRIKPGEGFSFDQDIDYLREATRRHLGETAVVDFEIVDEIPRTASGKTLFSISSAVPADFSSSEEEFGSVC